MYLERTYPNGTIEVRVEGKYSNTVANLADQHHGRIENAVRSLVGVKRDTNYADQCVTFKPNNIDEARALIGKLVEDIGYEDLVVHAQQVARTVGLDGKARNHETSEQILSDIPSEERFRIKHVLIAQAAAVSLESFLDILLTQQKIPVGKVFQTLDLGEGRTIYVSDQFTDDRNSVTAQNASLREYLSRAGFNFNLSSFLNKNLGIWRNK